MELSHLVKLISELVPNSSVKYVRGDNSCTFDYIDKENNRLYAKTPEGKEISFAESFLSDLADKITENRPFNTSQLLNNKGSNRAVVDSIIANTSEMYWLDKDRSRYTVWIPSHPHKAGELVEWKDMQFLSENMTLPQPSVEYIATPEEIKESFMRFWKLIDEHGADHEKYVSIYQKRMNPLLEAEFAINDVFSITALEKFNRIISRLVNKYNDLSFLQSEKNPTNNDYYVYSTFKRHKAFLEVIKCTQWNLRPNQQYVSTDLARTSSYRPYITAIKSKPFLLLAGISGTGKSRIVRELARACWEAGTEEHKAQKPKNFEMVQVKPNWHDSSELIGYVSRVSGEAEFVAGDFLKFVAKAWENLDTPHFLCLDEMNLAPVEQYFAEYLSVVESRKLQEDGTVTTDPILKKESADWYFNLTAALTSDETVRHRFNEEGICLPPNLIVVGTVNMDETTFSFSRKVLDRAMTIEMNEVDLRGGLDERHERIGLLSNEELVGQAVEGVDVYRDHKEICDKTLDFLAKLNQELEGTPFKVAYRTRNEFLLYVVNNLPYSKDAEGNDLPQGFVIARALDEITSMKVLSRIEGDDTKVSETLLNNLMNVIEKGLKEITDEEHPVESVSLAKLKEMKQRLASGYTSFWS